MCVSFSHVFDESHRSSPTYEYRNLQWFLELERSEETYQIRMFGGPTNSVVRPGVHWKIIVDVVCRVGKLEVSRKKELELCNCNLDEHFVGETLFEAEKKSLLENESVKTYQAIPVTVEIFNIEISGIRYFEMSNFKSPCWSSSDLTLSVQDEKFHCHSQILEQSSNVFKKMVKEMYKPTKLDLFFVAFLPSVKFEKTPFNIQLEDYPLDEFQEFLHHVYYPTEAVDDQNLGILLKLANKFEVPQLLHTCQQTMKVQLDHFEWKSWTVQLGMLAWHYNLEPLKMHFLQQGFGPSIFVERCSIQMIVRSETYHEMDEKYKLEMWELIMIELEQKRQLEKERLLELERQFELNRQSDLKRMLEMKSREELKRRLELKRSMQLKRHEELKRQLKLERQLELERQEKLKLLKDKYYYDY